MVSPPCGGGPVCHPSLLLQHPLPPQGPPDDLRNGIHFCHPDLYYNCTRPPSRSVSPARPRSPGSYSEYPPSWQPMSPIQSRGIPPRCSRVYHPRNPSHADVDPAWDQRPPHGGWKHEPERRRDHPSSVVGPIRLDTWEFKPTHPGPAYLFPCLGPLILLLHTLIPKV